MTLTLTENAATEIRNLVARPDVPEHGGVRIAGSDADDLTLSLAAVPSAGDTIVDSCGARVFLEQWVSELLADVTLDAGVDPQGQVQFGLVGTAELLRRGRRQARA